MVTEHLTVQTEKRERECYKALKPTYTYTHSVKQTNKHSHTNTLTALTKAITFNLYTQVHIHIHKLRFMNTLRLFLSVTHFVLLCMAVKFLVNYI